MNARRAMLLTAMIALAPAGLSLAQTAPDSTQTPSSQQRDTPKGGAEDATPAPPNSTTSQLNNPSQKQSTHMVSKQAMKDCIAKQQQDNTALSNADAKKACKTQMKGNSG